MPDWSFEKRLWKKDLPVGSQGFRVIAGADEVGRGAWAGPVVAAAVVFSANTTCNLPATTKIDDSKKLTEKQRDKAERWIKENCLAWGVGEAPASVINRHGLTRATEMAFRRAIVECNKRSTLKVDFLLIDAFYLPYTKGIKRKNQLAIVKGDSKSYSIAAASIIAKVYRDKLMIKLGEKHKGYAWERNKGYGTREHQEAIIKHGLTRLHRKAFVKKTIG